MFGRLVSKAFVRSFGVDTFQCANECTINIVDTTVRYDARHQIALPVYVCVYFIVSFAHSFVGDAAVADDVGDVRRNQNRWTAMEWRLMSQLIYIAHQNAHNALAVSWKSFEHYWEKPRQTESEARQTEDEEMNASNASIYTHTQSRAEPTDMKQMKYTFSQGNAQATNS